MNKTQNECPLSSKEWILFLNGEISNIENAGYRNFNNIFPVVALFTAVLAIIISSIFSTSNSNIPQESKVNIIISLAYAYIFFEVLFSVFFVVFLFLVIQLIINNKKVDILKKIRNNIINGGLYDTVEIREKWNGFTQLTYRDLLLSRGR